MSEESQIITAQGRQDALLGKDESHTCKSTLNNPGILCASCKPRLGRLSHSNLHPSHMSLLLAVSLATCSWYILMVHSDSQRSPFLTFFLLLLVLTKGPLLNLKLLLPLFPAQSRAPAFYYPTRDCCGALLQHMGQYMSRLQPNLGEQNSASE